MGPGSGLLVGSCVMDYGRLSDPKARIDLGFGLGVAIEITSRVTNRGWSYDQVLGQDDETLSLSLKSGGDVWQVRQIKCYSLEATSDLMLRHDRGIYWFIC